MKVYSKINSMLGYEFQKYLISHPEVADNIPPNALVIFQINDHKEFNEWSLTTSLRNREGEQPVVKVFLKKWRDESSLEDVEILQAA